MPTPVAASRRRFAPAPHPSPPRAWANAERWPKTRASCLPMMTSRRKRTELHARDRHRSDEHTSELQSLMRISYAVFCLKKKIHHLIYNFMTISYSQVNTQF